jgi:hypothetical protein
VTLSDGIGAPSETIAPAGVPAVAQPGLQTRQMPAPAARARAAPPPCRQLSLAGWERRAASTRRPARRLPHQALPPGAPARSCCCQRPPPLLQRA